MSLVDTVCFLADDAILDIYSRKKMPTGAWTRKPCAWTRQDTDTLI